MTIDVKRLRISKNINQRNNIKKRGELLEIKIQLKKENGLLKNIKRENYKIYQHDLHK